MPKCLCGRFIKPLGFANHRAHCAAYKRGPNSEPPPAGPWPFPSAAETTRADAEVQRIADGVKEGDLG